jgi:hypothetical protein
MGAVNLALLLLIGSGMVAYRALPALEPAKENAAIAASFPVGTTEALITDPVAASRVLNFYDYGGYLVWKLYPVGGRVFIDGRVEVYGPQVFGDYLRVNYAQAGWQKVVLAYHPCSILLPTSHPLVSLLPAQGWRVKARDPVSTLFVGSCPGE